MILNHFSQHTAQRIIRLVVQTLVAFSIVPVAWAQISPSLYDYVRSDLEWYTIETDHFLVHFHVDEEGEGSSRTARVVAGIAEDVFEPITALYDYEPDTKVSFVLKDYEDYSNGAAYFFDNVIEIWAPALDTPYRGGHNWLRNVISHEFTHIIQVQKSLKGSRHMPFYYLQVLDYEDVRRPDVLYGYPNLIATYPIPIISNPAWLAEGTAQYQRSFMSYDDWDSHRDMLLRTRILDGKELSLADMGGFYSHTSLMREGVYNQGFAFTSYLADRFGEEGLMRLTRELGSWGNWTFEAAAKDAFDVPGQTIYNEWIDALRVTYENSTVAIREDPVSGRPIVETGFNNFHPQFSPDGRSVAYLSNAGEDFSRTRIFVLDLDTNIAQVVEIPGAEQVADISYTCSFGHALTRPSSGPFDWHPDGNSIVYARIRDTKNGHLYSDLYSMDIESREETRHTHQLRARSPVWSPDGRQLVYVGEKDGTTNLFLLTIETGEIRKLTDYHDGSQVSDPVWHPGEDWIYFAYARDFARDILRIRKTGGQTEPVHSGAADERSPSFDHAGRLYYASDQTGIFNLYRAGLEGESAEQLTNELGGAFTPDVGEDGRVVYSRYGSVGYQIALLDQPRAITAGTEPMVYLSPAFLNKPLVTAPERAKAPPAASVDSSVRPYSNEFLRTLTRTRSDSVVLTLDTDPKPYDDIFTSFSFLPVLRLDQYVSRRRNRTEVRLPDRTRGETLWRNTKVGVYTGSREILGDLQMFGGLLVAPGSTSPASVSEFISPSNLLDLERDLFLQFDYSRGLGLLPARWSPQFSIELFNIRRNVEKGLALDEVPCTACYPDTTLADLSYNLWEVNFSARSKIDRSLLVEVGYRYSPYRVTTERFFSKELKTTVPKSSSKYFIGHGPRIRLYFEAFHPYRDADVVPHGLRVEAGFESEQGKLLKKFSIEDGLLKPVYDRSTVNRITVRGRFGYRLADPGKEGGMHGLGVQLRISSILGKELDNFYDDYIGGLAGARGYPFYALAGNQTIWTQLSYTFPLLPRIKKQFLFTYIDKLYARVFMDAALAWSGRWPGLENVRKDTGIEMRLGLGSYYLLPTAIFVSATYGLDTFDVDLGEGFVTPNGATAISYGNDFQWHAGVLFGFDLY